MEDSSDSFQQIPQATSQTLLLNGKGAQIKAAFLGAATSSFFFRSPQIPTVCVILFIPGNISEPAEAENRAVLASLPVTVAVSRSAQFM